MPRGVLGIAKSSKRYKKSQRGILGIDKLFDEQGVLKEPFMTEVVIERYYPDRLMCKGIYRSTYKTQNQIPGYFKILVPYISDTGYDISIPKGTFEFDEKKGWDSLVPDDKLIVGIVEAVDGDTKNKDLVLTGYVHMTDEGPVVFDTNFQRIIMEGDSSLSFKDDELQLETTLFTINAKIGGELGFDKWVDGSAAIDNSVLTEAFGPATVDLEFKGVYNDDVNKDYLVFSRDSKFKTVELKDVA